MFDPHENIDAYLLGKLSESERSAFEASLQTDPELKAELEFRKEVRKGLKQANEEEIRARIRTIASQTPKAISSRFWLAAASVALLIGIGGWFLLSKGPTDGPSLFEEYYHPKIHLDISRDPAPKNTLVDTLNSRYLAADYAFLEARLASLPDSTKGRNLQILQAVSLIELKRDDEANRLLTSLINASAGEYSDQAAWLKALLHLRNEQYPSAYDLLKPIAEDPNKLYQVQAKEILHQIETRID